jgi:hypothetical protein
VLECKIKKIIFDLTVKNCKQVNFMTQKSGAFKAENYKLLPRTTNNVLRRFVFWERAGLRPKK